MGIVVVSALRGSTRGNGKGRGVEVAGIAESGFGVLSGGDGRLRKSVQNMAVERTAVSPGLIVSTLIKMQLNGQMKVYEADFCSN